MLGTVHKLYTTDGLRGFYRVSLLLLSCISPYARTYALVAVVRTIGLLVFIS